MLIATILVVLALFAVAGRLYQRAGLRRDARRFPAPGRVVDIGTCRLHLYSQGDGTPAVVFEAGVGATSLSWRLVQPEIAQRTQAASYDRACLGWSESTSLPRELGPIVQELRDLLDRAGVASPRILVAHSYGALVAIAYAARVRSEVAGVVFVDPVSIPAWSEPAGRDLAMLARGIALARRGATLTRWGVTRFALNLLSGGARRVPQMVARTAGGRGSGFIDRMVGQIQKLPPETWPMIQAHWCDPKSFEGMARYLEALPGSAAAAAGDLARIGDLPLIVLSAERASAGERTWHHELAARSSRGRIEIVGGSGHWVQLDRPDAVIRAIDEMLADVRRESRS